MAPSLASFSVLSCRLGGLVSSLALVGLLATSALALTKSAYDSPTTAEGWAWARIKEGKPVDFNQRCETPALDARASDEKSEKTWQELCRRLSASFLVDVLTKTPWREQIPFSGVHIVGARIEGDMDLVYARIDRTLFVENSRIDNDVKLESMRAAGDVRFVGSRVAGAFSANQFYGEQLLDLHRSEFRKRVDLKLMKVDGNVYMEGALFESELDATGMQVAGNLLISTTETAFKCANLQKPDSPCVRLTSADVKGQLALAGASIEGRVDADSLRVGNNAFLRLTKCTGAINMIASHIEGRFDLRGATLALLDLSEASITGALELGGEDPDFPDGSPAVWRAKDGGPGELRLRLTHTSRLMDTENAWPEAGYLHLDGFTFDYFGGYTRNIGAQMRERGAKWWDKHWAQLDPYYSPSPYRAVAAAFTAAGDRDLADEIRYLGYVREQEKLSPMRWVWSCLLRYVAGFGIYSYFVLYWISAVWLAGAAYLWTCSKGVRDAGHGLLWCLGASLARLLPIIEVNKEFTDFFDDPKRERLTDFQTFVFSFIGVVGWFLAAVLIAAVSGITGKL
jgi:hypothetical protein